MSDKELIEKMNKKLNSDSSVKKIPVKIINKESNEKDDKELDKDLIDKLNKTEFLADIPEVKVEEKEDCCGNCCDCGCDCEFKEDNEPCDNTCSYDKLKDELNIEKPLVYNLKYEIGKIKDVYKKFEKSQWQEEIQKIIDKTPLKKFLGCSSRFLCTPFGQMFIDALATNPTYKWNDIIDKRKEFDSFLSFKNDISNVKNAIDTFYKIPIETETEKIKEENKTKNNPYKVFDFEKSKELINKLDCIDKGVPLTAKPNSIIDDLRNNCDTEEIISKIKNEIEKRKKERNKKANEVWYFIKDNVESMEDYMHKYDNQLVTINELNTLFEKYVDMWNLLKETI